MSHAPRQLFALVLLDRTVGSKHRSSTTGHRTFKQRLGPPEPYSAKIAPRHHPVNRPRHLVNPAPWQQAARRCVLASASSRSRNQTAAKDQQCERPQQGSGHGCRLRPHESCPTAAQSSPSSARRRRSSAFSSATDRFGRSSTIRSLFRYTPLNMEVFTWARCTRPSRSR